MAHVSPWVPAPCDVGNRAAPHTCRRRGLLPILLPDPCVRRGRKETVMRGYVARKGVRRVSHATLAARQAGAAAAEHVGRLPTQERTAHPADPRTHRDLPASPDRSRRPLRAQAPPHRRQPGVVTQVGARDPPDHPRRPRRRPPSRTRVAQHRARRHHPEAARASTRRTQALDRR